MPSVSTPGQVGRDAYPEPMLIKRAAVGPSPIDGWGLIATHAIDAGEVVDESPVLLTKERVPRAFAAHVYRLTDGRSAMPCGDGIFTNHCDEPNAVPEMDLGRRIATLVAICDIDAGDEVTIDYGGTVAVVRPKRGRR
jgi:uncharacterized protein